MDPQMATFLQNLQTLIEQSMGGQEQPAGETQPAAPGAAQPPAQPPGAAQPGAGDEFAAEDSMNELQGQVDYLQAVLQHHGISPEETGRMLYDGDGTPVWVPNEEQQKEEVKRPAPPARSPTPRAASNGSAPNIRNMNLDQRAEYYKQMTADDAAGRSRV